MLSLPSMVIVLSPASFSTLFLSCPPQKYDSFYPQRYAIQMMTYIDFNGLAIVVVVDDGLTALFDFQCVLRTETTDDLDVVRHDAKKGLEWAARC